jgi:hypothetical protein
MAETSLLGYFTEFLITYRAWLTFIYQAIPTDMDDQLVRRGVSAKVKKAFAVCLNLFSLKVA